MAKNAFFNRIKQCFPNLSTQQKKVAEYLVNHYEKAAFLTATRLGAAVGVSESTIVRFACVLGYEGFPKMQRALQDIVKNKLTTVDRLQMYVQNGDEHVLGRVLNADIANIKITLEETSREDFDAAIDAILSAPTIHIISLRSATILGEFLNFYLNFLFKNCRLISGAGILVEQLITVKEGDLVIGISFPRYTRQTIEGLQYAREKGAVILSITDNMLSPLAQHADITLTAQSNMTSFIDSFVAPLSLINALLVEVGDKQAGKTQESLRQLEEIWQKFGVYHTEE